MSIKDQSFAITSAKVLLPNGQIEPRTVQVKGGVITAIDHPSKISDQITYDLPGHILTPGMVNSHTHVAMGFFRGLGHGRKSLIESFLFPAEKNLTAELLEPLSYSYLIAGIKSGVTFFGDHYYFSDGIGKACERLGVRAGLGETIADLGGAFPSKDRWLENKNSIENWSFSDLIQPVIAPHAADTVSFDLLSDMAKFAKTRKLTLHMHLSQTAGELTRVKKRAKMTPVQYADKAGALTSRTLAVHLLSINENDAKILKKSKATAGLCPSSQMIYEHLAPIQLFQKQKLPIAIGTDCAACNDGGDLHSDLKLTALLARDRGQQISPKNLYSMVTDIPFKVFGRSHDLGKIEVGYKADLVALKPDISCEPHYDFLTNFIYSYNSRHVEHVMVNGKWILWNQEIASASEDTLRADYMKSVQEIQKRVGF